MKISKGIQFILLAALLFSFMNFFVKLVPHVPVSEIIVFRALVTLIISYFFLKTRGINPWGNNKPLLILRGVCGLIGLFLYFYAVQNIPLASAVTIHNLSPIFSTILAIFILKEKVKATRWLFFLVAFSGVAIIKGFQSEVSTFMLIVTIGSAIFSGLAYNIISRLKTTDHAMVVVFYFPLITLPIITPVAVYEWYMPVGWEWFYLISIGVCTQFAQYFMTRAYQLERMATVSMFNYSGVLYAIAIGAIFFGEILNFWAIIGICLVVGGILADLFYRRRQNRKAEKLLIADK